MAVVTALPPVTGRQPVEFEKALPFISTNDFISEDDVGPLLQHLRGPDAGYVPVAASHSCWQDEMHDRRLALTGRTRPFDQA